MTKKTVQKPEDAGIEEIDTDELRVKKVNYLCSSFLKSSQFFACVDT